MEKIICKTGKEFVDTLLEMFSQETPNDKVIKHYKDVIEDLDGIIYYEFEKGKRDKPLKEVFVAVSSTILLTEPMIAKMIFDFAKQFNENIL
jgi:hypothetical protein